MKAIGSLTNSIGIFTETFRYLQKTKVSHENTEQLKSQWAQDILSRLRVDLEIIGDSSKEKSVLFVGNHISYLDIPLLLSSAANLSFVAKHEISSWPIFGAAARKIDTVFVKRNNGDSRRSARESINQALHRGQRIVVFPSGTTCLSEKKSWRKGVFEIAHENNTFIQPFRISYQPLRAVAYINQDFFPFHLYKLFNCDQIQAKIEFHKPVKIEDPVWDCFYWNYWSRGLIDVYRN